MPIDLLLDRALRIMLAIMVCNGNYSQFGLDFNIENSGNIQYDFTSLVNVGNILRFLYFLTRVNYNMMLG